MIQCFKCFFPIFWHINHEATQAYHKLYSHPSERTFKLFGSYLAQVLSVPLKDRPQTLPLKGIIQMLKSPH